MNAEFDLVVRGGTIADGTGGDLLEADIGEIGGKRLTQTAEGYVATFVDDVCIQRSGQDTGARPGRLVRDAGV